MTNKREKLTLLIMSTWITKLTFNQGQAKIILPKGWWKKNIKPQDRYLYLSEGKNGNLIITTEEKWYDEKLQKSTHHKNKRTR